MPKAPLQPGLAMGARAALEYAKSQGQHVSQDYIDKLLSTQIAEDASNSMQPVGVDLPKPNGFMMNPAPLETFKRYNQPISARHLFSTNTRPVDVSIYSPVQAARQPIPFVEREDQVFGASSQTELMGGIMAKARGVQLSAAPAIVESKMSTDHADEHFERIDRKTKFVELSDTEKQMKRDAIKALRDMEGRYNLSASSLNQGLVSEQTFSSRKPVHGEIPVTDTKGHVIGSSPNIKSGAEDPENNLPLEYKILEAPPASVVPKVLAENYPGLQSYYSGASRETGRDRHDARPHPTQHHDHEQNGPKTFWHSYVDAWKSANKSAVQIVMIVATIVLGLLILFLLFGSVAWISQTKRFAVAPLARPQIPSFDPDQMEYEAPRRAPTKSLWTRRYE